jgi:hypothetical protein
VDIVDSHEVFLSQWQKRRKYYLQNNYTVMHTKSPLYVLDQWDQAPQAEKGKSKGKSKAPIINMSTSNLLANGVSAAAQFINNFSQHTYREDEDDDENSMLKGHCFI